MKFGDRIQFLLEQQELSQKEFAGLLNIAPTTLSSYIHHRREPDYETLKKMSQLLNVSADFLLGIPERETNSPMEDETGLAFQLGWSKLNDEQKSLLLGLQQLMLEQNKPK